MIKGDLCLQGLSVFPKDTVYFLLHHGMNIESVTNESGKPPEYTGHFGLKPVSVALRFGVPVTDSLSPICVKYSGAYPVYDTTEALWDYKERIAFNGTTVRADANTAWYPVLYHPESGIRNENVSYDIKAECKSCSTIYVNGAKPVHSSKAHLKSQNPFPLF